MPRLFKERNRTVLGIGVLFALMVVANTTPAAQAAAAAAAQVAGDGLTFDGDVALWSVAIKPDKTQDFDQVMAKLHHALVTSDRPDRRQQAAGWKVVRLATPLPDGNVAYVHMVDPVVRGADYTIMRILYEAYPDERQTLYELYRGAFAKNLSLTTGTMAADFTSPVSADSR